MPEQWTGDVVRQLHLNGLSGKQLAVAAGVSPEYVSMVLNGHREPKGAERRFREALAQLIQGQAQENAQKEKT